MILPGAPRRFNLFECAFLTACVLQAALIYGSWGDDATIHVGRIEALVAQLEAGRLSLFTVHGDVTLPTYFYYSFVPYILPVALDLAGIAPAVAFKLFLVACFLVFMGGFRTLAIFDDEESRERRNGYMAALIVFMTANYICGLWCVRGAIAEIWVAMFMPWVIRSLQGNLRFLMPLFFLQVCGHPVVLAQSLVGELGFVYAFGAFSARELLRRALPSLGGAIVLGAAFWLPQLLTKSLILGAAPLLEFSNSFQSLRSLFHPTMLWSVGLMLPGSILLLVALANRRLPRQCGIAAALFVGLVAMQSIRLRELVSLIPILNESHFVWRLMLPASTVGLALLLVSMRHVPQARVVSYVLLASAAISASLAISRTLTDPIRWRTDKSVINPVFGTAEFLPQYGHLPNRCEVDAQQVSFAALGNGAPTSFLRVHQAPLLVDYRLAGGGSLIAGHCGDDLVLGPVTGPIYIDQGHVTAVLLVRVASLLLVGVLTFRRRRQFLS